MGQQQLLLLVLSIMVVGVSLIMGIASFTKDKKSFEKDSANLALIDIAVRGISYAHAPTTMGGGKAGDGVATFEGFTMKAAGSTENASEGFDVLGDGSCFTATVSNNGAELTASWFPEGDCSDDTKAVLTMTVNGFEKDDISVSDGPYADDWRNQQ